jgi:hypothetical protein
MGFLAEGIERLGSLPGGDVYGRAELRCPGSGALISIVEVALDPKRPERLKGPDVLSFRCQGSAPPEFCLVHHRPLRA